MPAWPTSLPKPQVDGFQAQDQSGVVQFQPDYGEPMLRRGSTADVRLFQLSFDLNATDLATLMDFYRDDCAGGALDFTMDDPETGESASFVFTASPQRIAYGGSWFGVTVALTRLP